MYMPSGNLRFNYVVLNLFHVTTLATSGFFSSNFPVINTVTDIGARSIYVVKLQLEPVAFRKRVERFYIIKLAPVSLLTLTRVL